MLPPEIQKLVDNKPTRGYHDEDSVSHYMLEGGKGEEFAQRNFVYFTLASSRFFWATGKK